MKPTVLESSSVRVVQGFTARLDETLQLAGYRSYGRQSVVADFTGLTRDGVKKLYQEDRPPRPEALSTLLVGLCGALADKGIAISQDALQDYLLLNKGNITPPALGTTHDPDSLLHDISPFVRLDPVYTSKIIIAIDDKMTHMGIDTNDLKLCDIRLIQFRMVRYCHRNRQSVQSEKIDSMIGSLLYLAEQHLL